MRSYAYERRRTSHHTAAEIYPRTYLNLVTQPYTTQQYYDNIAVTPTDTKTDHVCQRDTLYYFQWTIVRHNERTISSRVRRTILNFHGEIMCTFGAENIYDRRDHGSAKLTSPSAIFYKKKKKIDSIRWSSLRKKEKKRYDGIEKFDISIQLRIFFIDFVSGI